MALPGQITVAEAFALAPASADKTAISGDFTALLGHLDTAVTNGRLTAKARDYLFYEMLMGFGQRIADELTT